MRSKTAAIRPTGFETAKEFYKALSEKLPELILLDIMLPDEDGLSILKRLRTRADTQKIPVILVTAKIERRSTRSRGWTAARMIISPSRSA